MRNRKIVTNHLKIELVSADMKSAFHGMRNSFQSWDKSDSTFGLCKKDDCDGAILEEFDNDMVKYAKLGKNDLKLAQNLLRSGRGSERKFLRQITLSFNVSGPLSWLKQLDTYKVGTVRNSDSTMHRLHSTPITPDSFAIDNVEDTLTEITVFTLLTQLEYLRQKYLETKEKKYWRLLVQLLPSSWNQYSTITANYEVMRTMYFDRRSHKLYEWHEFCSWIENLPYAKELITFTGEEK